MNLLGAKLYDPAGAVSKATSALLAMTAVDTTNLRLTVVVPAHGYVRFRLVTMLQGATTFPSILLGVMVSSTVKGRVAPVQSLGNTAVATALVNVEADFVVPGLTPGSTNFDAAYGVETIVASTNIKYGGPDNTTGNDAFGAFVFEAWDPQPMQTNGQLVVDSSGRVDVSKVSGTTQTARDLGTSVLLSSGTGTGQVSLSSGLVDITQTAADKVFGSSGATLAELAQAAPAATPSPRAALMLLYMALRNKLTTDTDMKVFNDAGTCIAKSALSDNGTTFTRDEMATGP